VIQLAAAPTFPCDQNQGSRITSSYSRLAARNTIAESGSADNLPFIPIRPNPSTPSTCSDSGLAARDAELESDSPEGGHYLSLLYNPSPFSIPADSDISAGTIAPNPDPPQSNRLVTIKPTLAESDPGLNYSVSSLEPAKSCWGSASRHLPSKGLRTILRIPKLRRSVSGPAGRSMHRKTRREQHNRREKLTETHRAGENLFLV
jgi:hypothetical protein